ncbi:MAG TPA: DNA-binding protein [bacterium]|nr:DNA-binding protein [bacterium]HPN30739.1 DNA-binding protein [bacterium]
MKYAEAKQGRIFVVRLEHGDIIHKSIETLAKKEKIKSASVIILGGANAESKLVTGPESNGLKNINPMEYVLNGASEIAGVGTIFPDESGEPILHMHIGAGRKDKSVTGCVRLGVETWLVAEAVIFELTDCSALRKTDSVSGFKLLDI